MIKRLAWTSTGIVDWRQGVLTNRMNPLSYITSCTRTAFGASRVSFCRVRACGGAARYCALEGRDIYLSPYVLVVFAVSSVSRPRWSVVFYIPIFSSLFFALWYASIDASQRIAGLIVLYGAIPLLQFRKRASQPSSQLVQKQSSIVPAQILSQHVLCLPIAAFDIDRF